jgi:two-component system, NarL family, nitrate/nitrite response regulator NarL
MDSSIRVAVVDDHLIFRAGVIQILSRDSSIKVIAEGSTAASACDIAAEFSPDLILLDIHVHGSGIEVVPKIKVASPKTLVVMLTASESESKVQMAFEAGARGYVLKGTDGADLARAVHTVIDGDTYITPTLAAKLLISSKASNSDRADDAHLTLRELDVSQGVALGMTNKEIAREFLLTEKTVKHHMTQILSKLGLRNRVELALHFANKAAASTKTGSVQTHW